MAEEAIKAEESENNARSRVEAPRPLSSAPRTTREGPTTTRQRPPAAQRIRLGLDKGDEAWLNLIGTGGQYHTAPQQGSNLTGRNIVTTLLQGTESEGGLGHGKDTHARGNRSGSENDGWTNNTGKGSADDVWPTALPA